MMVVILSTSISFKLIGNFNVIITKASRSKKFKQIKCIAKRMRDKANPSIMKYPLFVIHKIPLEKDIFNLNIENKTLNVF